MARPTISQRIALEGADQVKRALADLGKAGEDAFAQLQKAGEKVNLSAPAAAIENATKRASATVDELRQRLAATGSTAAQSGSGFSQFGGAVQATQQRLVEVVNIGARVGLAVQAVGTAFSGAFGRVREFRDGVTGAFESISGTVLRSVAVLSAVPASFLAISVSAANAAKEIKDAAIAAGTTPREYQKLSVAAEQLGGSEEKLVMALSLINEKVQEQSDNFYGNQQRLLELRQATMQGGFAGLQAAQDYSKLRREMELFGPSVRLGGESIIHVDQALKGLGPTNRDAIERLKALADQISALPTPAERASRVIEIFGRRLGPHMVELLSGGRQAIDEIGNRAERLGLIMSDMELKVGKTLSETLALLRRSVAATKNSVGIMFAPAITDAANLLIEAIGRVRTDILLWASDMAGKVRPVLLDLVRALTGDTDAIETGWIKTARQLIIDLGAAVAKVTQNIIVPAFKEFLALLQTIAESINRIFGTQLTAADVGVVLLLARMVGAFTLLANVIKLVGSAFGVLRASFVAVTAVGRLMLATFEALGSLFGILRVAVVGLIAAFDIVPIAIAAIGAAIGFLAVTLVRAVDWSAFAQRAQAALDSVWGFVVNLATGLAAQFEAFVQAAGALWQQVVTLANAAFLAVVAGAAAFWTSLVARWQSGIQLLSATWRAVVDAAQSMADQIVSGAAALWAALQAAWQAGIDAVDALWATLTSAAQSAWQAIVDGVAGAWNSIASLWSTGVDRIIGFLATLRDFALEVWNAIAEAARQAFGAQQQAASGGGGYARGGAVFGPGSATSDSIPAWLSNGEFVVRAAAVRKYGLSLFDALNRMQVDPRAFARFAEGGLVRSLQALTPLPMRFADGGLVALSAAPAGGSERPVTINIAGETFAMSASGDVVDRLQRFASAKQVRSAGRKPNWFQG